jgi:histidinol-phosphatase (PHP family)
VRGAGLKLGIECDFVPGAEDRTANLLEARDFDYVVGSVHFVGERAIDHEGWDVWEGSGDADEIWRRYFEALAECARSGLFDVLAHPDLVKVWGRGRPLPERDPRHYYEPAVEAIAASGIAVEVSTAGLRKPVGELYPARAFAEMCVEAGAPFALSSDAHQPEQVGYEYDRALEFLTELGVGEICVFAGRERSLAPLPARVGENR